LDSYTFSQSLDTTKILNGGSFGFDFVFDPQKRSKSVITVPVHPVHSKRDDKENYWNNNQDDKLDPEYCPAKSGPEIPLAGENRQNDDERKEEHGNNALQNCIAPVFNDEYASNDATITFENLRILLVISPMFSHRNDFSGPVPNNFIRIMESPHSLLHNFECTDC